MINKINWIETNENGFKIKYRGLDGSVSASFKIENGDLLVEDINKGNGVDGVILELLLSTAKAYFDNKMLTWKIFRLDKEGDKGQEVSAIDSASAEKIYRLTNKVDGPILMGLKEGE